MNFTMKVDPSQLDASLAELEKTWNQFFEGNPFETFFLDEFFDRQYRIEKQLNTAVGFFALVAILISVLIASPVTWILIRRWLEAFPYRVALHWWVFLYTGVLALIIALAAVSIQTLRAANNNPTESLKYEYPFIILVLNPS